jgi:hypothetical protein
LAWDSERELVTIRPAHVLKVLSRFRSGALSAEQVEKWANAIEGREDIDLEAQNRELLREAIFALANPDLQGDITTDVADRWIERIRGG